MIHSYDVETAQEIGVIPAMVFYYMVYWIAHNAANDNNYFDGDYWTYNSIRAYSELFPELTKKQIETSIKKLRESGYIKAGNYNTMRYDRTLWYALTDKGKMIAQRTNLSDAFHLQGKSISPTEEINFAYRGNQFPPEGKPIPVIIPNIIPKKNTHISLVGKTPNEEMDYQSIAEMFNSICTRLTKVKVLNDRRKVHRLGD